MPFETNVVKASFMSWFSRSHDYRDLDIFNVPSRAFEAIDGNEGKLESGERFKVLGNVTFWVSD